jgi:hypothetical protein
MTGKDQILSDIDRFGVYAHFPENWETNSKDLKELEDLGVVMSVETKFKDYLNSCYHYTRPDYLEDLYIHYHTENSSSIRHRLKRS